MFNSFIRSVVFHLVVVLIVVILPNYINFSKKTVTTEIPIEVVDISEKTKIKKKRIEKEVKEQKEDKRLSSILKSIDKLKTEQKKIEEKKPIVEPIENDTLDPSEKLTISELDMIRRQFINCWNVPAGAKNIQNLQVLVKIKLDEDGNVIDSELVKTSSLNDSFYRAAAESAMRAVRHPSCKKLKVPVKKYKTWKNITLNFDPSMLSK